MITCLYYNNVEMTVLMQLVLSATLSRLLPLQFGFERFQYQREAIQCAARITMSFNVRPWLRL